MRISRWFPPLFLLAIVAGILVPISPLYRPIPSDDPSVYLYVGQRLLEGGLPYRDAWDHKQPLAYLLFAFGQALTPHSLWGMWWVEAALLAIAVLLAWLWMRRVVPGRLAFLSVSAGLLTLSILIWGYSLEELALPLQIFPLFALVRFLKTGRERERIWLSLAIGISAGLGFFLKQSLIAAALTVGLYLGVRMLACRQWVLLRSLAAMTAGFAAVSAIILAYLFISGIWPAYQEAAFAFNLAYANLGLLERVNALLSALVDLTSVPGLFLTFALWLVCAAVALLNVGPFLVGWLNTRYSAAILVALGLGLIILSLLAEWIGNEPGLGLAQSMLIAAGLAASAAGLLLHLSRLRSAVTRWLSTAPIDTGDLRAPFFAIAALLFPITMVLITLSGRNYVYYFIALVPAVMLIFGLVASLFSLPHSSAARTQPAMLLSVSLVLALAYHPILLMRSGLSQPRHPSAPEVVQYVQAHTHPQDTILVWGKDTTFVYFSADRKAPSRQFYQAPIALETYNEQYRMAASLLGDLQVKPPALFIIMGTAAEPGKCTLDVSDQPNSVGQIMSFICQNYRYTAQAGEFQIYQHVP